MFSLPFFSCHLSPEEASRARSQQASQYSPGDGGFVAPAGEQEHRRSVPQQVDANQSLSAFFVLDLNFVERANLPFTLFRIHIEEINQTVLMHMTEKMNYKHSEVLSAVLTNRACHTLAVYFLLNKKMKRLSKEYRVSLFSNPYHYICHMRRSVTPPEAY